jgi:hypothetical protein
MIMSNEQRRKYDIFTVQFAALLTVIRDERTEAKYYVKENGAEIVEIIDKHGAEIAHMDVTSMSLISAVQAILILIK